MTTDEIDPRIRRFREIARHVLQSTNHADVMKYLASQHRDVVIPFEPQDIPPRRSHRVGGARTSGHGNTK